MIRLAVLMRMTGDLTFINIASFSHLAGLCQAFIVSGTRSIKLYFEMTRAPNSFNHMAFQGELTRHKTSCNWFLEFHARVILKAVKSESY